MSLFLITSCTKMEMSGLGTQITITEKNERCCEPVYIGRKRFRGIEFWLHFHYYVIDLPHSSSYFNSSTLAETMQV